MLKKVLQILQLPKTIVIGNLSPAFNPYTLFLPFCGEMPKDCRILITALPYYAKNRIIQQVPYTPAEEQICTALAQRKPVFALDCAYIPGCIKIPDSTTRLITYAMAKSYPFGTMYIPKGAILTPLAAEENIKYKEFEPCESEKFAEVFGQPRKTIS